MDEGKGRFEEKEHERKDGVKRGGCGEGVKIGQKKM